jgi:hypothetical protein
MRTVLIVTAAAVGVLGAVFLVVGLSTADQVASTVGALAGVAGLGFSIATWARDRRSAPPPTAPPSQVIQGGQFGDDNIQNNTFN